MPGVDWIPGVSQLKSVVQLLTGDVEGATRTLENFLQECPVVSQVTSLVQLGLGEAEGALETQKRCLGTVNNVANGIPLVGHVKGVIHHAVGDHDGGNQALNAATRSSVVLASGAAAGITTVGLAAIPAGIAAGGAYDIADTLICDKPKGILAAVDHAVKHPSAGAIFDATAVVVGDGFAGYAGGKIGNNMAGQVKLGKLEAARVAKMDRLDVVMFEEGSSMTSGEFIQLGQKINILTGEINAIRHSTPQYWFDPKTNRFVALERGGGGGGAGGVAGISAQYRDQKESKPPAYVIGPDSFPKVDIPKPKTFQELETGFDLDFYLNELNGGLTPEKRRQKLEEHKKQESNNQDLTSLYENTYSTSDNDLRELKEKFDRGDDPRKNLNKRQLEDLTGNQWFHVRMPREFEYTGAIMTNRSNTGLLHTFQRHWSQWQEHIAELDTNFMQRLAPIRQELLNLQNAFGRESTGIASNALNAAIQRLSNEAFIEIQSAFYDAQLQIHGFIQNNVTYSQYLGEGITDRGDVQVYFKVADQNGNTRVMALCVSKLLTQPMVGFSDQRKVRQIVTVFFFTWNEYANLKVRVERRAW